MQERTEEAEASIPTENVRDSPNLNRIFTVRRKSAKRTFPWDLTTRELHLASPSPLPQAEDIPVTKKPRREEPFSGSTDEAAAKISAHDTAVRLPAVAADADPVKRTQATDHWRLEEDAKLISGVTNTRKTKYGKEYRTDWAAVAALVKLKETVQTHGGKHQDAIATLVPGQARIQCRSMIREHNVLDANFDRESERTGTWTKDEVIKLKAAVQTHGDNNWGAIAALLPGRTRNQCLNRWKNVLEPSIEQVSGRTGKWTALEVIKLKAAVQLHGGKDWAAIAKLVPGRTKIQCSSRWHVLDPNIDRVSGRTGKWTAVEDSKLKAAVQTHGGKNWDEIAMLVPGRAQIQCRSRWHNILNADFDRTPGRTGTWTEEEVIKLQVAVKMHGGKNWDAIATLVPGRTRSQCWSRWKDVVESNLDRVSGRTGKWAEDEDSKLKDAVHTHGGKNWDEIATLVPGRTQIQCRSRWKNVLDPSIDRASRRTGTWTEDEVSKLKAAVRTHGDKNWGAIAALVPGRTRSQCLSRWKNGLDPNID
jgi:hypothetical protein